MKCEIKEAAANPTEFDIKPLYGLETEDAKQMIGRWRWELTDAEYFIVMYQPKDKKLLKSFIPKPLELVKGMPLVGIFIQQKTINGQKGLNSLNQGYLEFILSAMVTYKGISGMYAITIMIESDMGAMLGREMFGTPKKVAEFDYKNDGKKFSWAIKRRGITLAELEGEIKEGDIDATNIKNVIGSPTYHLHQIMSHSRTEAYAYSPRLMEMIPELHAVHKVRECDNVKIAYHESPFDPICLLAPKEVLSVTYLNANTAIGRIRVLEELDDTGMLPFRFAKCDPF